MSAAAANPEKEDSHGPQRPACPTKEIIHRVNEAVLQRKRVDIVYYILSHFPIFQKTPSHSPLRKRGSGGIQKQAGPSQSDIRRHRLLPPRPAEAKQAVAARGHLLFCLKGMHILPGQVARVKRVCLRYVSVCLRLINVYLECYLLNSLEDNFQNNAAHG